MMANRVSIDWKFQPKLECCKGYNGDDDRISQLPDDILVAIVCLLSLKDAARTSVLSSRWINLWKHTSSLHFDAEEAMHKIGRRKKFLINERGKYVKCVNSVLRSHEAVTLKEFRICFDFSKSATKTMTKWLKYAFAKQVQRLEFDLSPAGISRSGLPEFNYVFPEELLTKSSGRGSPSNTSINDNLSTHYNFKNLKVLSLKFVSVTREAIEFFLNNSPLLEKLIVHRTQGTSNLEFCGSSLALKHLELCYCNDLESIKVSAPNLISFTGIVCREFILENVPMLDELTVGYCYYDFPVEKFCTSFSCCISQLGSLTLLLKNLKELSKFPEMPGLKKMVICCWTVGEESMISLTSLIRASPNLQEFVVKLNWLELSRSDREVESITTCPHEYLKVVKFCGYYGRRSDVEFVRYFLVNCAVLEKVIIDPHCITHFPHVPIGPAMLADEITARRCAKQQLESQVPQHIELVIL